MPAMIIGWTNVFTFAARRVITALKGLCLGRIHKLVLTNWIGRKKGYLPSGMDKGNGRNNDRVDSVVEPAD